MSEEYEMWCRECGAIGVQPLDEPCPECGGETEPDDWCER